MLSYWFVLPTMSFFSPITASTPVPVSGCVTDRCVMFVTDRCVMMRHDVLCCAKYYRDTTRMFASSQASTFAALAFATGQYDPPQLDWLLGHERV